MEAKHLSAIVLSLLLAGCGGGSGGGVTPPPQPPSNQKDNCPNGDYSPNAYDGQCGTKPTVPPVGSEVKGTFLVLNQKCTTTGEKIGRAAVYTCNWIDQDLIFGEKVVDTPSLLGWIYYFGQGFKLMPITSSTGSILKGGGL